MARPALEVARPEALVGVTKTAFVKERPGSKCRSFSTAGSSEGGSTGRRCSQNVVHWNYLAFVSLTTLGYGGVVPMTAPSSLVYLMISGAGPFTSWP